MSEFVAIASSTGWTISQRVYCYDMKAYYYSHHSSYMNRKAAISTAEILNDHYQKQEGEINDKP